MTNNAKEMFKKLKLTIWIFFQTLCQRKINILVSIKFIEKNYCNKKLLHRNGGVYLLTHPS